MKIRTRIAIICEHFRHREGHKPGFADVTPIRTERYLVLTDGGLIERERQYFLARPNFFYFRGCGRPCYLPLNPGPQIGGPDWAVTEGWPCEFVSKHDRSSGPYCYCEVGQQQGDKLMVIGQIRGQYIR
ncbi:hypothetical protein KBC99_03415, partial [Candidatus Saccharibacteria bacterium]|nr:hypothetical protein [Candidatus Saccharibacteria bacterium]